MTSSASHDLLARELFSVSGALVAADASSQKARGRGDGGLAPCLGAPASDSAGATTTAVNTFTVTGTYHGTLTLKSLGTNCIINEFARISVTRSASTR